MRDLSRRLMTRPRSRARNDERGAIGVLVTVFIAAGVLFGMGALVIDVGRLYQNRAELQNGADAGALAVAKSCATGSCPTSLTSATSVAGPYANATASSLTADTAGVSMVCGVAGLGTVGSGACTANPPGCPVSPTDGSSYVDVQTHTLLPSSKTLLPPVFAEALVPGYNGTEVFACAQAEWGVTDALGFTICTTKAASVPAVAYPVVESTVSTANEVALLLNDPNPMCPGSAGNFGWTNNCPVVISGLTYGVKTGISGQTCATQIKSAWQAGSTAWSNPTAANWDNAIVFIPLYSQVQNPGNNAVYTLASFIGFVITGYNLPAVPGGNPDWLSQKGGGACGTTNGCISGFFVNKTLPAADTSLKITG